jgi:hypothetical protein
LQLARPEQTTRFFGQYSELLEKKHPQATNVFRRPDFFSFATMDGEVFLHCGELDCVVLEGGNRDLFAEINKQIGLGAIPGPEQKPGVTVTHSLRGFPAAAGASALN